MTLVSQPKPSIVLFDDRAGRLQSENVRLIPTIEGEVPRITAVTLVSQPKPPIAPLDDRAGKLQSENVRLMPTIKGKAPSTAAVTLVSQPKPPIVLSDDRAGKLQSENVNSKCLPFQVGDSVLKCSHKNYVMHVALSNLASLS